MKEMRQQGWCIEEREISQAIMDIVIEVGNVLKEHDRVRKIIEEDRNARVINGVKFSGWRNFYDYPSICIFLGELAEQFTDQDWDKVAHKYMLKIQEIINTEGIGEVALFGGVSGVGMAGFLLSRGGIRYTKFVSQMNGFIIGTLKRIIPQMYSRLGGRISISDYDVIRGISGIGRYLLFFKGQPAVQEVLEQIVRYVIELTKDIVIDGQIVPGWYIAREQQFLPEDQEKYPHGNFNLGLAHGIPGPLALLSLVLLHNIEVPGQRSAIRKITDWLMQFQLPNRTGGDWPRHISWEEQIATRVIDSVPCREGWCYGTPGVARAMYLAGRALSDESLKDVAVQAFDAVFTMPKEKWGLPTSTFCHGLAGLLHLTHLMYLDTGLSKFHEYRKIVLMMMLKKYPEGAFGFYQLEQTGSDLQFVDRIGIIDGSVGSALSLLALLKPIRTNWSAIFLVN